MKKLSVYLSVLVSLLAGCDGGQTKAKQQAHLASLTCESSKQGRSQEELQAIADACFKRGSFTKSSGRQW